MEVDKREQTWARLKNQAISSLELEKVSLGAVCLELEQLSDALSQLAEMQKDYHPDQFDTEKDTSIDALRRNWTFLSVRRRNSASSTSSSVSSCSERSRSSLKLPLLA